MAVAMGARTCGPGATPIGRRSPPGRPLRCCLKEPRAPERGYRKPGPKSPSPTQHSCGFQGPVRLVQKTALYRTRRGLMRGRDLAFARAYGGWPGRPPMWLIEGALTRAWMDSVEQG